MGVLVLDRSAEIELDDRRLEHVFAVMIAKLRRKEPVVLSWTDDRAQAHQAYVHPAALVRAEFDAAERPGLDRQELERLMRAANTARGIQLTEETADATITPFPERRAARQPVAV